ncbi:WD40-repeat-containing domain protein [Lentinula raphanica]|nr:WD40-repeat-containing domain protein [Lentinula raphanica]
MSVSYKHHLTLHGMRDAVLSVSFSAGGKFVAATGYGGVSVWDLCTAALVPLPQLKYTPQNPKYVVSSSTWLYFSKTKTHVLVLGTLRGDLMLWKYDPEGKEFQILHRFPSVNAMRQVISLDVYRREVSSGRRGRIAALFIDGCVTVWALTAVGDCTQVFSCNLEDMFLPKVVRFCGNTRDVFVFARSGGLIVRLDYKTGQVKKRKSHAPSTMGSVALDQSSKYFVAWTTEGFQIHDLESLELIQNFETQNPIVHFPKHVVFGEEDHVIIGGTDRGCALVYNVSTGTVMQTLAYPRGGLVQHVSTISLEETHLVAIAGSTRHQSADVLIFQKPAFKASSDSKTKTDFSKSSLLDLTSVDPKSLVHVGAGFYTSKSGWRIIRPILAVSLFVAGLVLLYLKCSNCQNWTKVSIQ